ncbi:MAG TPA: hypothetical protein VNM14_21510 [Planctomycetota bacterium]|jgi:hypothetical protein|nr:hypothetical protein [Planctomycetota bacterium]
MRTLATLALLLGVTATSFAQDPNRNRMNEPYPEVRPQESLGHAPAAAPPATANRMNVQYPDVPASELAGGPDPSENRLNMEWAQPESKGQAEKPSKKR